MLMKKEFSTAARRRATVTAEPPSRRQRQQSSNPMRATHMGGTTGHPETETHWVSQHDNAGRQPFPGPLTMVRLRNAIMMCRETPLALHSADSASKGRTYEKTQAKPYPTRL